MKETLKELRRVLSKYGVASRKGSEEIIRRGRIIVNGKVERDPLKPVYMTDEIFLDGQRLGEKEIELYALNKPKGFITTMAKDEHRAKVADLMPEHTYLFPVGRLDRDSRGLLLFTNDNDFSNFIQSPRGKVEKTYRVQIKGDFIEKHLKEMKRGIFIEGFRYTAKDITILKRNPRTTWIEVVLTEGKNREIRRMLDALGYEVLELIRIQIGKLRLKKLNIGPGQYIKIDKSWVV